MFFLKKIFTQYIEKSKFLRERKEYVSNFEQITNTKYEILKQMYSRDILPFDIGKTNQYPSYDFPSRFELYVSIYNFPASEDEAKQFVSLVNDSFLHSEYNLYTRINGKGQMESLHLNIRNIFSIKEIDVYTNSNTFIEVIKKTRIQCPPVWVAFPDLTLAKFHPSQGETGYYNEFYWNPFWSRLNENEKEEYYSIEDIPKEWAEYMHFLDELRELD